ncbi:DUF6884 domain-containing protein [Streptomyces sp. NPDC091280]|uniref:DUF6884 domain-containing protein n=1 Tax=Streptomyces sp. NPDC091280 TaxID=3365984 RepID=UPI0038205C60
MIYPTWHDQGNGQGPDRLCDDHLCFCMGHTCDCDVCTEVLDVPALKVLNDSHEYKSEIDMTNKIEVHLPAALRKWVTRTLVADTQDEHDLMDACKALGLGNSMKTTTVPLANGPLGVLVRQARKWAVSNNNTEWMAGKSVLSRHELDYVPATLAEVRYAVKLTKSLSEVIHPKVRNWGSEGLREEVGTQLVACSWSKAGMSGRVGHETLGWLLGEVRELMNSGRGGPVPLAADKFIRAHEPGYIEQAEGWAMREKGEVPAERERVILVACGGKKKVDVGVVPAGEMYVGSYHLACRKAAEALGDRTLILSAMYGLVPLDEEIAAYNVTVGDPEAVGGIELRRHAEEMGLLDAKVTVLGGERYVSLAREVWPDAEAPLSGGIGQQLQQLAGIYKGEPEENDQEQAGTSSREWQKKRMGDLVTWSDEPSYFYYGGTAKQDVNESGPLVFVSWRDSENGKNKLIDVDTQELVEVVHSMSYVWAVKAEKSEPVTETQVEEPVTDEVQGQEEGPLPAYSGRIGDLPDVDKIRTSGGPKFWFGGKAGKTNPHPGKWIKAGIKVEGRKYVIYSLENGESLFTGTLISQIHWGKLISSEQIQAWLDQREQQDPEPETQEEQEPEKPDHHYRGSLQNYGSMLPSRGRSHEPVIWFGGKAGKKHTEPGTWTKVKIVYTGDGIYDLVAVGTGESVRTVTLRSQIFWAYCHGPVPAVEDGRDDEDQEQQEPAAVEETAPPGGYEVPENFLELAEDGNTEAARKYWTRRCEEYRRTGK